MRRRRPLPDPSQDGPDDSLVLAAIGHAVGAAAYRSIIRMDPSQRANLAWRARGHSRQAASLCAMIGRPAGPEGSSPAGPLAGRGREDGR